MLEHDSRLVAAVLELSTQIASELDLSAILRAACETVVNLLNVNHSGFVLFNRTQTSGVVRAEHPEIGALGMPIQVEDVPLESRLIREKQPILVREVADEAGFGPVRNVFARLGIRSVVVVPVVIDNRVVGSFSLDTIGAARDFTSDEIELCKLFAGLVAVAIKNARLFRQKGRRAKQLENLRGTMLAVTSPRDRESLLHTILTHAAKLLRAKGGGIYQYYHERRELTVIATVNPPEKETTRGTTLRVGEGIAGRLVESGEPSMIVPDYNVWFGRASVYASTDGFGAVLAVPLRWKDRIIGVLWVDAEPGHPFGRPEARLLRLFADQAAIALVHAELTETNEQELARLEALSRATKEIMGPLGARSLDERLDLVAQHATRLLDAETSGVLLVKREGFLSLEAGFGHREGHFTKGRVFPIQSGPQAGRLGQIAHEGKVFNEHGEALARRFPTRTGHASHTPSAASLSLLVVPLLKVQGGTSRLIGLLRVDNKRDRDGRARATTGFSKEDETVLQILAEAAVVVMEGAELMAQLRARKEHYERLVSSSPVGIIAVDMAGMVTHFNEQAEAILGYGHGAVLNTPVEQYYYEPGEPRRIGQALRTSANGHIAGHPTSVRSYDGRRIPIRLSATWLYDPEGKPVGSVGYFEDLRSIEEAARRLELLLGASHLVAGSGDLDRGLQGVAEMLVFILGRSFCRIVVAEKGETHLVVRAAASSAGTTWEPSIGRSIRLSDWEGGEALLRAGKISTHSLDQPEDEPHLVRLSEELRLDEPIRSLLVVPLTVSERILGVMHVGELRETIGSPFSDEETELAAAIAGKVLIDRIQLHEIAERQRLLLTALNDASREIRAVHDTPTLLQALARAAVDLIGGTYGGVFVDNALIPELKLAAVHRLPDHLIGKRVSHADEVVGAVVRNGYSVASRAEPEATEPGGRFDVRQYGAVLAVPLMGPGRLEAVLFVADENRAREFAPIERDVLERLAATAALSLESSRLMRWEQRMFAQLTTVRRVRDYVHACADEERILHATLTGATAGYGLRFNRAAVFLLDAPGTSLVGRMAIGSVTEDEAKEEWRKHDESGLEDFDRYIERLERDLFPRTRLDLVVRDVHIPLRSAAEDPLSRVVMEGRPLVSDPERESQPEEFRDSFQPCSPVVIVPLAARDQVLGVIVADNAFSRVPVEDEPLRTLADTAALALDRLAMVHETQEIRRQGLRELASIQKAAGVEAGAGPRAVMKEIARHARDLFQGESAVIWSYHAARRAFVFETWVATGIPVEVFEDFRALPPQPGGVAFTVLERGWVGVEDVQANDRYPFIRGPIRALLTRIAARSFQGMALVAGGEPLAALLVNYDSPREFDPTHADTARAFANSAALNLKSAMLVEQMRLGKQAAELLARATLAKDARAAWVSVAEHAREALACDGVAVYEYHEATGRLRLPPTTAGTVTAGAGTEPATRSLVYELVKRDEPFIAMELGAEGVDSLVALPLRAAGRRVGVILAKYPPKHRFTEDDTSDLTLFANQAAVAIANAHQREELRETRALLRALAWLEAGSASCRRVAAAIPATPATGVPKDGHGPAACVARLERIEVLVAILGRRVDGFGRADRRMADDMVVMPELVRERLGQMARAADHGATPEFVADESAPDYACLVQGDRDLLGRVLDWVLDNAAHATAASPEARIVASVARRDESIRIVVTDSGPGIPEAERTRLFHDPIPKSGEHDRLGVSLLVARAIVRAFGGELSIETTGPGGTTIALDFPVATVPSAGASPPSPESPQ